MCLIASWSMGMWGDEGLGDKFLMECFFERGETVSVGR